MKLPEYEIDKNKLTQAVDRGVRQADSRRPPLRTALIAACVLALALGTLATAQVLFGTVDWRGRPVQDEYELQQPAQTPTPHDDADQEKLRRAIEWADEWSESKPDDEYWISTHDGGSELHYPSEQVASVAEVGVRIKGSGLKIPEYIPDGYALTSARLEFYFTEDSLQATELISEESGPDGLKLYKYRPGPTLKDHVSGYRLEYHNAQDQRFVISAWLDESSTNHAFGLQPRVDHSVEQVAGMDEAFLYHYLDEGYWRLITLQKNLPSTNYLAGEYDAFPGQPDRDAPVSTGIYDAAEYDIHISAPDKDEVLKIAEGLVTPR